MPSKTILLNNGLVNSRSPVMLGEGELSEAVCVEYRPNDPAVHKMAGHTKFEATQRSAHGGAYGMFYLRFNGYPSLVLVGAQYVLPTYGTVLTSFVTYDPHAGESSKNFILANSDAYRGLSGPFDCVNYLDNYYILHGGNFNPAVGEYRNFYIAPGGLAYHHGMMQNRQAPAISYGGTTYANPFFGGTVRAGTSVGYALTGSNTITYWIEERVKDSLGNIIRRNTGSAATTITVGAGTAIDPLIIHPPFVNADATHWALYATALNGAYPTGFELDEASVSDDAIEDTRLGTDATIPAPNGTAYPTITAIVNGITLTVPRYGAMPRASFGDIFEDCLVTNDLDNPKYLAWSFQGDPQAFPAFYRFPINSKEGDSITMIRRIGGVLIVGMTDSVWRIYTLPRYSDASFDVGRVKGQVEGAHGAVSQAASCLYGSPDNMRLAYASSYGIRTTDGTNWLDATADFDWVNGVAVDKLSSSFMLNNPAKYRLEFYYADKSVSYLTYTFETSTITFPAIPNRCIYLHYHPSHAKPSGAMKITGPHPISATAGCVVSTGTSRQVWLNTTSQTELNSQLVKADEGTTFVNVITHEDSQPIAMSIKTGEHYLAGVNGESVVDTVTVNHTAGGDQQEATVTITRRGEGSTDRTDPATIPIEHEGQSTISTGGYGLGESHKFGVSNSDALGSFGLNYIAVEHKPVAPLGGFAKSE